MPGFKIKEQEGYNLSTAEMETLEAISVLGDPGADRILFWDESANTWKFLTIGTGLNITGTTLTSTGLSNPMTAIGDMIYGDTAGAVARLAGNTTTTKKFLTSVGDGTNSTAPAYSLDFSTDGTFSGNSDTIIPSQKAIKTYVDGSVAGLLDYRGGYDASGNTYPVAGGSGTAGAVLKGDMWIISVAGTLGGEAVQVGDSIIANVDTPAQTASKWNHLNANISYVPENVANRLTSFQGTPDDTHYISEKLAYDQLALKANLISPSFTTPNIGAATGTSLDLEGTTLGMLTLKNTEKTSYTRMAFEGTQNKWSAGVGNETAAIEATRNKFYIYDTTNTKVAMTIDPSTLDMKLFGGLGLGGDLDLNGNDIVKDLAEDKGDILILKAGENLAKYNVVYLSGKEWKKANAGSITTSKGMLGIAMETKSSGENVRVLVKGVIKTGSWTEGDMVYLSTTSGAMSDSLPTDEDEVIRLLGTAISTTEIYFNPDNSIITLADD